MKINDYINKYAEKKRGASPYWTIDKAQFESARDKYNTSVRMDKAKSNTEPKKSQLRGYTANSAIGAGVGAAGAGIANFSSLGKTRNKAMAFGALGGAALGAVFNHRRVERQNTKTANNKKKQAAKRLIELERNAPGALKFFAAKINHEKNGGIKKQAGIHKVAFSNSWYSVDKKTKKVYENAGSNKVGGVPKEFSPTKDKDGHWSGKREVMDAEEKKRALQSIEKYKR
tara:strand:+ start:1412 stop:2098 length:687 start_codon:yes stop_codon:yes gene_type:complete